MKILSDKTIFDNRSIAPTLIARDSRFYYVQNRISHQVHVLHLGDMSNEMIYANALIDVELKPGAYYRREKAHHLSIEYIHEGTLLARQNGRCYELECGDVFLMHPEDDNEFMTGAENSCRKSSLTLYGPLLLDFLNKSGLRKVDVLTTVDQEMFHGFMQRFKTTAENLSDRNSQRNNGLLCYELLQFLQRPERRSFIPKEVTRLFTWLSANLDHNIQLSDMLKTAACSRTHLINMVRECYDKTPHQLLIALRMEKAAKLLLTDYNLSIKEIAANCGYSDPLNFSTAFKRKFGQSPLHYRHFSLDMKTKLFETKMETPVSRERYKAPPSE